MNGWDYVIIIIIVLAVALAFINIRKNRNSCSGICAGCAYASGCSRKKMGEGK